MAPAPTTSHTPGAKPRLTWLGRALLAIIFVAGVAFSIYLGLCVGLVLGVEAGGPALERPTRGIGLAPDLSGLVEFVLDLGLYSLGGLAVGLVGGLVVMGLVCRYALLPLARAIPGLTKRPG